MSDFEAQIRQSREEVAAAQGRIREVTGRMEAARADLGASEALAGIETATLEDVRVQAEAMNANIAELIMGLDDVTSQFSREFDAMRNRNGMEKLIGLFSRDRSEQMRQERLRHASIDDKLQDLIAKSDEITRLLGDQLSELEVQKERVGKNLSETLQEREAVVSELEALRKQILEIDPKIIDLENKIAVCQDAADRTRLESALAATNSDYNAMVQDEQVKIARSQTLERYVEQGKSWVDSLQNQAATQTVLINKLQTDTRQRVVLYDALSKSLKTAQQQEVAHRINEIGTETDRHAQQAMAQIGAATNARMADMLEAHEGHMVFAREVQEAKAKADERFARRFRAIVEKHDSSLYGG